MPPKGQAQIRGTAVGRPQQSRGAYARDMMNAVTSPENRTVVTALAFFAGSVAFLHSSWSEILLPPL